MGTVPFQGFHLLETKAVGSPATTALRVGLHMTLKYRLVRCWSIIEVKVPTRPEPSRAATGDNQSRAYGWHLTANQAKLGAIMAAVTPQRRIAAAPQVSPRSQSQYEYYIGKTIGTPAVPQFTTGAAKPLTKPLSDGAHACKPRPGKVATEARVKTQLMVPIYVGEMHEIAPNIPHHLHSLHACIHDKSYHATNSASHKKAKVRGLRAQLTKTQDQLCQRPNKPKPSTQGS